ncbi:hypothetical protein SETIT_2G294700v2 [Setaria italica]|uniref:Uncharacterized protein n=1 Tax=Setaria italica TaxID=4555 RepID=A0A368Q685_SETIT|nr:hypothetical protein SETIT_2G294700v2 [Setaria italica]
MASSSTQDPSEPPKTPRPIFIPHWRWRRPRLPASAPATATTPHAVFIPHRRRRRPGLPAPSSSRIGTGGGPALSLYRTGAALDSLPHRRRPRFPAMSPSCIGTASARGIATGRQGGSARNRRWRWQPGFELVHGTCIRVHVRRHLREQNAGLQGVSYGSATLATEMVKTPALLASKEINQLKRTPSYNLRIHSNKKS